MEACESIGFVCMVASDGEEARARHPPPSVIESVGASLGASEGASVGASGLASSAFIATHFGAAAAAMTWLLAEWMVMGKPSVLGGISGAVAGLVAITPASGFVKPMPALLIGAIAGVFCFLMVAKIKAACDARRDKDFMIITRTDAIAIEGLEAALERGERYREAGADMLFIEAPVGREQVEIVSKRFKGVPLLYNMAASGKTPDLPADELGRLGFNLAIYPNWVILAAIPAMRQAGGGSIVNIASDQALIGKQVSAAYGASKAAVINMAKAVALDVAHEGIRVNAVCPGPTKTGMTEPMRARENVDETMRRVVPMARWGESSELAAAVSFLLSPDASFITGIALPVDGGVTATTAQFPNYQPRDRD